MSVLRILALIVTFVVVWPALASASVKVTFVHPEQYSDPDLRGGFGSVRREATLPEIKRYLEQLGSRYLKPGEVLRIEVLDIQLAGQYEPWRPQLSDVRILRDVTPPRFKLRYRLEARGRVQLSAEEAVSDINYLMNPSARFSSDRLVYEKAMLADWFRRRIGERKPAA